MRTHGTTPEDHGTDRRQTGTRHTGAAGAPKHLPRHMQPVEPGTVTSADATRDHVEGSSAAPVASDALPTSQAEPLVPSYQAHRSGRRGDFEDRFQREVEGPAPRHASAAGTESQVAPDPSSGRRRRRVPLALKVLIVLVALIAVAGVAIASWVGSVDSSMDIGGQQGQDLDAALQEEHTDSGGQAFYTLIIGSDARSEVEGARSDVMILARVEPKSGLVTLVSIPRDTMVTGTGGEVEKLNAELNYGPAATVRAVSTFAGVDISHYVEVSFDGLKSVVDQLGGVTIDVPEGFTATDGTVFTQGEQTLSGDEALAYARDRYHVSGGDFGRARAQRQIVEAVARQVLASPITQMPSLIQNLANSVKTDLSVPDIVGYALDIQGAQGGLTVYSCAVPSYTLPQDGVSYVGTQYDEWRAMMQRVDAGLDPNDTSATIPDAQASNDRLGAATNAASPHDYASLAANAALTTDDVVE